MTSRRGAPGSLMGSGGGRWPEPQRDRGRLHRFLHHCYQVFAQAGQVYFVAQRRAKGGQRPCSVVLAAIETTVDDGLDTTTQRLEQDIDSECRDDNRYIVILLDDR